MNNNFFDIGERVYSIIGKGDIRETIVLEVLGDGEYIVFDGNEQIVVTENCMFFFFHHARLAAFDKGKEFYFFPAHLMGEYRTERSVRIDVKRLISPTGKGELVDIIMESGMKLSALHAFASNFEATQAVCMQNKSTDRASINYHTISNQIGSFQAVHAIRFDSLCGICGYMYLN